MGTRLESLDLDDARWHAFVARHPDATAFHHPAWSAAIAECYGFRPIVAAAVNDAGDVSAGIPLLEVRAKPRPPRLIGLPFTDHCRVLANGSVGTTTFAAALADVRASHGVTRVDVRDDVPGGHQVCDSVLHVLPLAGDLDATHQRFDRNIKRNIRRATRAGVEVHRGDPVDELVDTFYPLHVQTRRRLGVPVQSKRFFSVLARRISADDLGFVSVARLHGEPVAAGLFLAYNGTLIYKYGASNARGWDARATHLMLWDALQYASEFGYRALDFGLSAHEHEGLRTFKSDWGATETPLVYTVFADRPPANGHSRALDVAGAVIKRSPAFVTKMLGSLFYRYGA
jgi:serine/alanine adding enzyme